MLVFIIIIGFTGFYWVSLGFTGFYWGLLGFTGFYCIFRSQEFFCVPSRSLTTDSESINGITIRFGSQNGCVRTRTDV